MTPNPHNVRGEADTPQEVIDRKAAWSCHQSDAIAFLDGLPAASVQLVIGSPQYANKGGRYTTGDKAAGDLPVQQRGIEDWVEWMLECVLSARRVSAGDVILVVNGPVDDGCYGPAVEGLLWRWWTEKRGDPAGKLERPVIWSKNAPPNRKDWFGNDHEHVLCFPAPGKRRVWNWEAIGTPPKFTTGGAFRQRGSDGVRKPGGEYPTNPITRPRDVVKVPVGGGMMGHDLTCRNEAPYPLKLVEHFIKALSNPGDVVCDPWSGSGTTCHGAIINGRGFVGCDLRESQVRLCRERMGTVVGW